MIAIARFPRNITKREEHRLNEQIKVPFVMLITDEGENLGKTDIREAIRLAKEAGLDLVEVSPNTNPPVCKLLDYGKFKYLKNKKAHEAKKNQKIVHIKEVKMTPKTDTHDFEFKMKHLRRFLMDGDKAKITIVFRGRQMVHPEIGMKLLERATEELEEIATVEQPPQREGRHLSMIFIGKPNIASTEKKTEKKKGKSSKKSDESHSAPEETVTESDAAQKESS